MSLDKLTTPPATTRPADLLHDPYPGFYIYQMSFLDSTGATKHVTGVYGVLELSTDELSNSTLDLPSLHTKFDDHILAHELTIPSGTQITLEELGSLVGRPGTGPVWAISLQSGLNLTSADGGKPLAAVLDSSGVYHQLWQIRDKKACDQLAKAVESSQLIVADGHHRIARAMKKLNQGHTGTVTLLCFVTELDMLQAEIRPIHRCFKTELAPDEVLYRLSERYNLTKLGSIELQQNERYDALVMLFDQQSYAIRPKNAGTIFNDALQSQEIAKLLGAKSTQYLTDVKKLKAKLQTDSAKVGLLTRPVTIDEIRQAALLKKPLPPKSTMFYPKPLSGLILGDQVNL